MMYGHSVRYRTPSYYSYDDTKGLTKLEEKHSFMLMYRSMGSVHNYPGPLVTPPYLVQVSSLFGGGMLGTTK